MWQARETTCTVGSGSLESVPPLHCEEKCVKKVFTHDVLKKGGTDGLCKHRLSNLNFTVKQAL